MLYQRCISSFRRPLTRCLHFSRTYADGKGCRDDSKPLLDLDNKVAAIIGGTGGIGFATAHQLLENKLCHVALIDQDIACGQEAVCNLNCAHGKNKAMFFKGDILIGKDMEEALNNTMKEFKRLDIVVNAAGIWDGCGWDKEVNVNLKGAINLLLSTQKIACGKGQEAFLLNFSGTQGIEPFPPSPTLAASFSGVVNLCRSYGHVSNHEKSKLRVVTVCVGATQTDFVKDVAGKALNEDMKKNLELYLKGACWQKPVACAKSVVHLAKFGISGTVYVMEGSRLFLLEQPHWRRCSILVKQFV